MLPFTKRPGRDEAGDVVTKDNLVPPAVSAAAPSKRSVAPPRKPAPSYDEEEMTTLVPSKALGDALPSVRPAARPAAGAPPSMPPARSRPATVPPPKSSVHSGRYVGLEDDDDEEDCHTVVRGAPRIVKRANANKLGMPTAPTTISPAAVIKATLESARANSRRPDTGLVAGPPRNLLEDRADVHQGDPRATQRSAGSVPPPPSSRPGHQHPAVSMANPQMQPGSMRPPASVPPPSSHPASYPPPGSYPPPSHPNSGYPAHYANGVPSSSVPGVVMSSSMPAHFMVPQAPYSGMDPPGTAVTSGHKVYARPATSWAVALLAFGLFVGVGAIAVMQSGSSVADTTASFVNPSIAAQKAAAAQQPGAPMPMPVQAPTEAPRVGDPNAAPPGLIGASPQAMTSPVAAGPVQQGVAPAQTAATAAPPAAHEPKAKPPTFAAAPPRTAPPPKPEAKPEPKPEPRQTAKAEPPPKDSGRGKPAAGKGDTDEETRKALEALQKAQLESSSSFGDK